jgi:hypothetical protein
MAHVAEQRAVRLVQLRAPLLAGDRVGLGEVERDDAVGVAGGDRLGRAGEHVEREPAFERQAQLEQLEHEPALGRLGGRPLGDGVVGWTGAREPARRAQPLALAVAADHVAVDAGAAEPHDLARVPVERERGPAMQAFRALEGDQVPAHRARERAHPLR